MVSERDFTRPFGSWAISVAMLPVLVFSALLWWMSEIGVALVVLLALYIAGVDLSAIWHRYEVLALFAMAGMALCLASLPWFRCVLSTFYREADGLR